MAALSGQPSTSFPAPGEMVGLGARRKVHHQVRLPYSPSKEYESHSSGKSSVDVNFVSSTLLTVEGTTKNGVKKRERRHVYYDIMPLKLGTDKNFEQPLQSKVEHPSDTPISGSTTARKSTRRNESTKPAIPPKPKFLLRDKRIRHVYQTIDFPGDDGPSPVVVPPPLPNKPARLQRLSSAPVDVPPPLPPRVINEDAIRQRQNLDQEYIKNLRKSVDEELLGLAEEVDLPVHINPQAQTQRRNNYGAHSPPLNMPATCTTSMHEALTRRHSTPIYESITDANGQSQRPSMPSAPAVPLRANSLDIECDEEVCQNLSSEVNLAQNLLLLKRCGWYWGNMTWQEAEALLSQREGEGVFLMRDSQNPLHLLTITVRSTTNSLHHVRVEYSEGKFQLYEPGRTVSRSTAECVRHSNIKQFINLAIKHSKSGSFLYFLKPKNMGEPPIQIRLLTPISRLSKVKSLKYLSRMAIRNCVVADLIPSITLPSKIRKYLMSGPYYDPNEYL